MIPCRQCGKDMNPAVAMLGPVCLKCARRNHKLVLAGKHREDEHPKKRVQNG